MQGVESAAVSDTYREIVGTFRTQDDLESAISALSSAGWDRAEMSILAKHGVLEPEAVGTETTDLADDERTEREAVTSDTDVRQRRTLATGMAGVVGAFVASGATILTGGTALAAVVGAAAVGGGAAALVDAIAHRVDKGRGDFLRDQVEHGGILLWARLRDAAQERTAEEILRRCGASDVHVHETHGGAEPSPDDAPARDAVEEASLESFPASDPPAWTGSAAGSADREPAEKPPRGGRGQG